MTKYSKAELDQLPKCSRRCGIFIKNKDDERIIWARMRNLDEAHRRKVEGDARHQMPPLREEGEVDDERYETYEDTDVRFLVVSGDGAGPGQGHGSGPVFLCVVLFCVSEK